MHRYTRGWLALALAWWVVTYGGRPVSGPYDRLGDCNAAAEQLHAQSSTISRNCVFRRPE